MVNHSVSMDLFTTLPAAWAPFAEHTETLELEMLTRDGRHVTLQGRVTAWPDTRRMFVEGLGGCPAAGMDAFEVASAMRCAVRDRLVGSEQIQGAVLDGYRIGGMDLAANGDAL